VSGVRLTGAASPVRCRTIGEVDAQIGHLPNDSEIILYCTCLNEESAARAAKILMDRGSTRVRPLQGGLEAWADAGYMLDEFFPSSACAAAK